MVRARQVACLAAFWFNVALHAQAPAIELRLIPRTELDAVKSRF